MGESTITGTKEIMFKVLNKDEFHSYMFNHGLRNTTYFLYSLTFDNAKKCFTRTPIDNRKRATNWLLYQYYMEVNGEKIISHSVLEYRINNSNRSVFFLFEHQNDIDNEYFLYNAINQCEGDKAGFDYSKLITICFTKQVNDQSYIEDRQTEVRC